VHTKVRNRLSHQKLHKLVYVNYNLRLRLKDAIGFTSVQGEDNSFSQLMELSLYDTNNPIRQWMEMGHSNSDPELDEEDTENDTLLPSSIVAEGTPKENLVKWTKKNVGDTHIGKRNVKFMLRKISKKAKEVVDSYDETDRGDKSPQYQESADSSSTTSSDDVSGGAGGSGVGASGGGGGGSSGGGGSGGVSVSQMAPIHFIGTITFSSQ
jgi:uncharacterized membrane protein YgcG